MTIHYGRPYSQCRYCGKHVRMSGLFAGIHICVSDEERSVVDHAHAQALYAREQQRLAHKSRLEALARRRPAKP